SSYSPCTHRYLHSFPTRRSSDLLPLFEKAIQYDLPAMAVLLCRNFPIFSICGTFSFTPASGSIKEGSAFLSLSGAALAGSRTRRSEEHTSELQSLAYLVCRLLLE